MKDTKNFYCLIQSEIDAYGTVQHLIATFDADEERLAKRFADRFNEVVRRNHGVDTNIFIKAIPEEEATRGDFGNFVNAGVEHYTLEEVKEILEIR